uniref:Peptidase S1 domain-containing protein n=1 Tax=Anopheles melas TaxID=34690 RepID=A0A182UIL4_9DIPT
MECAAHCLYDRHKLIALDRLAVILGRAELSVEEPWSRSYAPERLILHPGYKQANVKDDIALVKLASEITTSDYIFPVCLWPRGLVHEDITGRKGFVVGYGLNDAGSTSNHLLDVEVPVVDRWTCLESNRGTLSSQLASTMLCAGARDGVGPCNGDSGGGMFFRAGNEWHIRGIVSFAPNLDGTGKCDPKQYAIYTDVAKYLDWIANELGNVTQGNTSEGMANSTDFREGQTWLTVNRDGCGLEAPVYTNLRHSASAFVAPWVTKIEYVGEERAGRDNECQAYLITEWHLLTLASCVADVDQNEQELYVRLGKFSIPGFPKPQIRYVEQIIIHERFDKSNNANDVALLKLRKKANVDEGFVNSICLAPAMFEGDDWITQLHVRDDIALIKVTTEIDMSAFIQPVCLWPSVPISGTDIVGRRGAVVGFGLTELDKPSDVMLDAEVPVVDLWSCLESNRGAFGTHLARTMLCAGGLDGVGPCNGDSGGGLFLEIGGVWYVRGIVSFAPNLDGVLKCDPTQYTVFTDVAKYLDWIAKADGNGTLVSALRITNKPVAAQSMINSAECGKESTQIVRERTETNSFIFPWATTIEFVGIDYRRQNECLAYLISEWHLLTSATCVQDVEENEQE